MSTHQFSPAPHVPPHATSTCDCCDARERLLLRAQLRRAGVRIPPNSGLTADALRLRLNEGAAA